MLNTRIFYKPSSKTVLSISLLVAQRYCLVCECHRNVPESICLASHVVLRNGYMDSLVIGVDTA